MSALGLHVGELQRVTMQLETDLDELDHYETEQRASIATALSNVAVRLELARNAVLGGQGEASALSLAHASLVKAESELEAALAELPSFCVESCRFLKAELRYVLKRLANIRKVIGDSDDDPMPAA